MPFAAPLSLLALLGAQAAHAADAWTVQWIAVPDGRGGWREVETAGAAHTGPAEAPRPLSRGQVLAEGAEITVALARVKLQNGDEELFIREDSALRIGERGLAAELGALWLHVEGAFRVEHGSAVTVVEGTRFTVEIGPEGARVSVEEGAVRVIPTDPAQGPATPLRRGQQLALSPAGGPGPVQRRPAGAPAAVYKRGAPSLLVSTLAELSVEPLQGVQQGLSLSEELLLVGPLRLRAQQGLTAGAWGWHGGAQLGLSLGGERLRGAAGVVGALRREDCPCGGGQLVVKIGAEATLAARLPLGRRLGLGAELGLRALDQSPVGPDLGAVARGGAVWAF